MAMESPVVQTAIDFQGLAALRREANQNQHDEKTLRQVASQFESLFVDMMLKSMRKASLAKGIFDTTQSDMYRDMADQQLAIDLSNHGGLGLQDVIMRQLSGKKMMSASKIAGQLHSLDSVPVRPALTNVSSKPIAATQTLGQKASLSSDKSSQASGFDSPQDFIHKLWSMAKKAANKLGVAPEVILSQAALETGWGKHIISQQNGHSSHNLFNIKADSGWSGKHAIVNSVEYRDGIAVKESSRFRVYDSYQQSFDDYVNFLKTQPRYQHALKNTQDADRFVEELHKAGFATDPDYADKIKRIMKGATLAQNSQQLKYS